jgi:hypothetical protein
MFLAVIIALKPVMLEIITSFHDNEIPFIKSTAVLIVDSLLLAISPRFFSLIISAKSSLPGTIVKLTFTFPS